jgi:hypothetical protein
LDSPEKLKATLAIRTTYGHALETFVAFLAATAQAPECLFAWLLKYHNGELRSVVRKITDGQPIRTRLKLSPVSWESLATLVHTPITGSHPHLGECVERVGRLWHRLATEFLEENHEREYNSIKHGMRATAGNFAISGHADPPAAGVETPAAFQLDGSGAEFKTLLPISGNKRNLQIAVCARSWSAESLVLRIRFISMSLTNTVQYLLLRNGGAPQDAQYRMSEDAEMYEKCWEVGSSLCNVQLTPNIGVAPENLATSEDILNSYKSR